MSIVTPDILCLLPCLVCPCFVPNFPIRGPIQLTPSYISLPCEIGSDCGSLYCLLVYAASVSLFDRADAALRSIFGRGKPIAVSMRCVISTSICEYSNGLYVHCQLEKETNISGTFGIEMCPIFLVYSRSSHAVVPIRHHRSNATSQIQIEADSKLRCFCS